jgi:valyl-tRNA synthetase
MSEQWFLKMKDIAQPAIKAVNDGTINFHPSHWIKTFNHWMENVKDWCLSRQLWWGHRIPVFTCLNCNEIIVQVEIPEQCQKCGSSSLEQDPDVLDTWASSWLWPFAVFTWPDKSKELDKFYPTNTLVTGPDIIFFWVARMIIAGYEFLDQPPFKDVYFTSILRDEKGRKFSKSLGNSPDPFDLFSKYGTDAVRFGIMLMAPQGLDVLFSNERLEVGRNFMNKLWNASRFVTMNLTDDHYREINIKEVDLELPEKWILSRLQYAIKEVNKQLDQFHFNEAAKVIYEFVWSDYCDWYIEIAKTRFTGTDLELANTSRAVAVHVIKNILALLHPFAPFITEELWNYFKDHEQQDLIISPWPSVEQEWIDKNPENQMNMLKEIISAVRTIRSSMNVPPSSTADMIINNEGINLSTVLKKYERIIQSLCNVGEITYKRDIIKPNQSAVAVVRDMEIFIPLGGLIDLNVEKKRLDKRKNELNTIIINTQNKLNNQDFLSRAPENVIQKERSKLNDLVQELEKVNSNLEMLL